MKIENAFRVKIRDTFKSEDRGRLEGTNRRNFVGEDADALWAKIGARCR